MQINEQSKLYGYCPAVPRMLYDPHKVNKSNMASTIIRLLETRQTLMVSGKDQGLNKENTQIGKTFVILRELIPALEQKGFEVEFVDIRDLKDKLPQKNFFSLDLKETDDIFESRKNIIIIDEIHYSMPVINDHPSFFDKELATTFWSKVNALLRNNCKMIFISGWHPLCNYYKFKAFNDTISLVITSPVIELEAKQRI